MLRHWDFSAFCRPTVGAEEKAFLDGSMPIVGIANVALSTAFNGFLGSFEQIRGFLIYDRTD